ncbi:hypothetical protein DIPPA_12883 [Diplonema papillatum]|nr:hypothetical protein DIPPA_12883 [Diplonema papillatum]
MRSRRISTLRFLLRDLPPVVPGWHSGDVRTYAPPFAPSGGSFEDVAAAVASSHEPIVEDPPSREPTSQLVRDVASPATHIPLLVFDSLRKARRESSLMVDYLPSRTSTPPLRTVRPRCWSWSATA